MWLRLTQNQTVNITYDKEEITKDTTDLKKILRYYKKYISSTFENLDKMMFLEKYNFQRLTKIKIESMKRPILLKKLYL